MELLQLEYFLTVAKLEHMTKAAQELRIAQPALSKTIARLEQDLGVPLFDRQGRKIRLNPYGQAFMKKAKAALDLLKEGRREVSDLAGMEQGRIHLALSSMESLSEPLGNFLTRYPEVNFRIIQSSIEEMGELIESSEVDFFLTAVPIKHPSIRQLPLLNEDVYVAVPYGHRFAKRSTINLAEVADEPFIGYKEGHPLRTMNDEFCQKADFTPNIVCEVEDPGSIATLVSSGFGVAFIGDCKSSEELSLIKLSIEQPVCQRTFRIAWLENRYLSKAALTFRDFLVEHFSDSEQSSSKSEQLIRLS